jgi:hypothetical protein
MANIILFLSSLFCSLLHIFLFNYFQTQFLLVILHSIVCCTSIYNHGTTSYRARWLDRGAVAIMVLVDYWVTTYWIQHVLLFLSVSLYLYSKYSKKIGYHVFAHLLITSNHAGLYSTLKS